MTRQFVFGVVAWILSLPKRPSVLKSLAPCSRVWSSIRARLAAVAQKRQGWHGPLPGGACRRRHHETYGRTDGSGAVIYQLSLRVDRPGPVRISRGRRSKGRISDRQNPASACGCRRMARRGRRSTSQESTGLPAATGLVLRGSFSEGTVRFDSLGVRLSDGYGVVRGTRPDRSRAVVGPRWESAGLYRGCARRRPGGGSAPGPAGNPGRRVASDWTHRQGITSGFNAGQRGRDADCVPFPWRGSWIARWRAWFNRVAVRSSIGLFLARYGVRAWKETGWIVPGDSLDIRAKGRVHDLRALDSVIGQGLSRIAGFIFGRPSAAPGRNPLSPRICWRTA